MGEQWQSSFKYRGVNRVSICKNFAQCLRKKAKSLLSLRYIFFAKNSTLRNHSHTSIRAKLLFSAFALFLFAILILFNSQTRLKLLILVKLLIGKNYALRNTSGFVEITPKNCANTRKTSQKKFAGNFANVAPKIWSFRGNPSFKKPQPSLFKIFLSPCKTLMIASLRIQI